MAAILVAQYMHCAICKCYWRMAFSILARGWMNQRRFVHQSMFSAQTPLDCSPSYLFSCKTKVWAPSVCGASANIEVHLMEGTDQDVASIANMVYRPLFLLFCNQYDWVPSQIQLGVSSARSDYTKSLKGPILDWIVPVGQSLSPPLTCNVKTDCGFHHEQTGALLCPCRNGLVGSWVDFLSAFI